MNVWMWLALAASFAVWTLAVVCVLLYRKVCEWRSAFLRERREHLDTKDMLNLTNSCLLHVSNLLEQARFYDALSVAQRFLSREGRA